MKRFLWMMLAAVLLVGCGAATPESAPAVAPATGEPALTPALVQATEMPTEPPAPTGVEAEVEAESNLPVVDVSTLAAPEWLSNAATYRDEVGSS
jgi:hypothetical protein